MLIFKFSNNFFSFSSFFIPLGSVFLDVNPSICFNVNPFGYVLSTKGLNEDGKILLKENNFRFHNVQRSVEKALSICEDKGFLGENADTVEIRVDENLLINEKKITDSITALAPETVKISVFEISKTDSKKARKKSIPAKRVRAISIYTEHFGSTFEENESALRGYSSEDILKLVLGYKIEKGSFSKKKEDSPCDANMHFSSEKRKNAIQAYTDAFGGIDAENAELLQGFTNKEIYKIIESKKEEKQ